MKRLIALLCAVLICLSSCAIDAGDSVVSSDVQSLTDINVEFILNSNYKIVRADDSTDGIPAAQFIRSAIEEISGEKLELKTDWVRRGEDIIPGEFEILVGPTNRKESIEVFNSLKRKDWKYVVYEGKIIICGGGEDATLEAAKAFCADLLGYNGDTVQEKRSITLNSGVTRDYYHDYSVKSVTLNGRSITDYVLALPGSSSAYRDAADRFNDLLSKNSGIQLPIKVIDDLGENELYIKLGQKTNPLGSYAYSIESENGILTFTGDSLVLTDAVDRFLLPALTATDGEIHLEFPDKVVKGFGGQQNDLVLDNETAKNISDGIEYKLLNYKDKDGKPVKAYALIVEPGKAQVINGTPGGAYELHNVKATTVDAAKAAEKQGYRVLAGVNADFFRISSDYSPQGPCIKNGNIMSIDTTRPYFGVTKDGKYVIEEASALKNEASNLSEAVGGRFIILKNGKIHQIGYDDEFGYTRHPRTAVGYDDDGRLYLVVVDGRQPSLSNGASLTDLAIILLELGATDALNLDGGGSSTFILENGDGFKAMNSPSDGSLRKVYNSLLIVAN